MVSQPDRAYVLANEECSQILTSWYKSAVTTAMEMVKTMVHITLGPCMASGRKEVSGNN